MPRTSVTGDTLKVFLWWDDFHTNTVSRYAVFRHEGSWGSKGGWHKGSMSYDSAAERASITTGDDISVLVQPSLQGRNVVIEADLYFTRIFPMDGAYEAYIRVVDTDNYYYVSVPVSSGFVAVITKVNEGRLVEIANAGQLAYPLDTWHHISIGAHQYRRL